MGRRAVRPEPDGPSKPKTEDFETPRAGERWRSPCSAARRRRAMKAMIVAAGLATLSALASAAPMHAPGPPPVLTDIRWDILPPDGNPRDDPRLISGRRRLGKEWVRRGSTRGL